MTLDVRADVSSLHMMPETAYATDPDPDGSDYTAVPCENLSDPPEGKVPIETSYADNSNQASDAYPGPDAWELSFDFPGNGLLTSPGDNQDPAGVAALTYIDHIAMHVLGSRTNLLGSAVSVVTDADTLTLAQAASRANADPLVLYQTGHLRAQWGRIIAAPGGGVFDFRPPTEFAINNTAISRGIRVYRELVTGGPTMAFVHSQGSIRRTLLGGRCTQLLAKITPDQKITFSSKWRGDSVVFGGKASLPAAVAAPALPEMMGALSPVFLNGVSAGHVGEVNIDFGIQPLPIASVHGTASGRGGDEVSKLRPKITIDPVHSTPFYEDVRDGDIYEVLIQFSQGLLASGILNTHCLIFDRAQAVKAGPKNANGLRRVSLELAVRRPQTSPGHHIQWAVA